MTKHIFISYSHIDLAVAESVLAALEQRGLTCWMAPRDVTPGGSYAESILTAIEKASCFVLIYSENSNTSSHVLREVERALKFGVNIVPVRFDDSIPSKSLDYLLATVHWLAIPQESRDRSIAKAAEQIAEWLTNFLKNPAAPLPVRLQNALVTSLEPPPRRRTGMWAAAAIVLALVVAGFATGRLPFPKNDTAEASSSSGKYVIAPNRNASPVRKAVAADLRKRATAHQAVGYAETILPQEDRPQQPPDPSSLNPHPSTFQRPPPPPPRQPEYILGPNAGPPMPPPPPRGRPGFRPGDGPSPGQFPNPGEPPH